MQCWLRGPWFQSSSPRARLHHEPCRLPRALPGAPCMSTHVSSSWAGVGGRGGGALPARAAPQLRGGLWNRRKWGVCFRLCPFYWVLHSTLIDTSPPSPEKKNWTFAGRDPLTWYPFDFSVGLARELFSHVSDPQEKAGQLRREGSPCAGSPAGRACARRQCLSASLCVLCAELQWPLQSYMLGSWC